MTEGSQYCLRHLLITPLIGLKFLCRHIIAMVHTPSTSQSSKDTCNHSKCLSLFKFLCNSKQYSICSVWQISFKHSFHSPH